MHLAWKVHKIPQYHASPDDCHPVSSPSRTLFQGNARGDTSIIIEIVQQNKSFEYATMPFPAPCILILPYLTSAFSHANCVSGCCSANNSSSKTLSTAAICKIKCFTEVATLSSEQTLHRKRPLFPECSDDSLPK